MTTFDSTDLNNAVSQSGVVHENTAHTSHSNASKLEQGYQISNPMFASSLIGYWPLQEASGSTAYDFSGNGNNGTANGGAGPSGTGTSTAPLGTTSWLFDGTDDYVSAPIVTDTFFNNPHTVAFWLSTTSTSAGLLTGIYDSSTNDRERYSLSTSGTLRYNRFSNNINGTTAVNDGSPHFATFTYSGTSAGNKQLYTDGSKENSSMQTSSFSSSTRNSIDMGGNGQENRNYLNVSMGIVYYISSELSASEVQQLYNVVATKGTLTTQYKPV